jgi:hypothetical protein
MGWFPPTCFTAPFQMSLKCFMIVLRMSFEGIANTWQTSNKHLINFSSYKYRAKTFHSRNLPNMFRDAVSFVCNVI